MKKLISAASALAMAASMVGAAVPFATGAADSTKGFELRAFTNKAGETVSTSISADEINAGDVTIPVGVYVVENTPDIKGLCAQWTIDSKDGDASEANVSFAAVAPGSKYFDSAQDMTLADGSTVSTDLFVGFCGTLTSGKKGMSYTDLSPNAMYSVQESQLAWGCKNPWGSVVWIKPTSVSNYDYTGKSSDAFPMFVFEVTFKKGTPEGTYTIDFLENSDDTGVPATYIEAGIGTTVKHTVENKNISLKGLEIKIGDGSAPAQSTTAAPAPSTTAATTKAETPSTTTPVSSGTPAGDDDYYSPNGYTKINPNFIVTAQDYVVVPGEDKEVVFEVNSGDSYASSFIAELNLPEGVTATLDDPTCYADPDMHNWELHNGFSYQIHVVSKVGSNPVRLLDSVMESEYDNDILQVTLHIPDDLAPGEYTYGFKAFDVVEFAKDTDEHKQSDFMATKVNGKLIVEGEVPETTAPPVTTAATTNATTVATTAATTKGETPKTTANTTKAPVGNVLYGDSNCDGKVNIADVVVLNRHLADAKYNLEEQGIINADCCDEKGGAGLDKNDSDAIIKYIVSLVKELPCTSADLK